MRLPMRVLSWEYALRRAATAEVGSGIGLIASMRLRTAEAQFRLGFDSQPLTVSANCADVIWGASDGSWLSFLLIDGSTYSYPADTSDSYDVVDEHGALVSQTATITIDGVNDQKWLGKFEQRGLVL